MEYKDSYIVMVTRYGSVYPISSFSEKSRALASIKTLEKTLPPTKESHFYIEKVTHFEY